MAIESIVGGSEERLKLSFLGEVKEWLEDCIFIGVFEIVIDDVHEMEVVEDFANDFVGLWGGLTIEESPLLTQLVGFVFPGLESGRVDDGRLNDFGTGEDSPRHGVWSGDRVRAEVARLVNAVVGDRGGLR